MRRNNLITLKNNVFATCTLLLMAGCADFQELGFHADKPESVIQQEELNSYESLKSYVDRSSQPDFKLGGTINLASFDGKGLLYRLFESNFDELYLADNAITHLSVTQDGGNVNAAAVESIVKTLENSELGFHSSPLLSYTNQNGAYLRDLVADIIIPGENGTDVVINFENDALGTTYPMTSPGSATVVLDPTGDSGNSLLVVGVQTFPQFSITLPEGRTLRDYVNVSLDFRGAGCCGLYGGGMRLGISTTTGSVTLGNYDSPANQGAADNVWARGRIILPLANLNLSEAQKDLSTFVLTVGSATGGANYLIDNITMQWEIAGQTIIKTPEEKEEIITAELDKYVGGIIDMGKSKVRAWTIVNQPMSDSDPTQLRSGATIENIPDNEFYWNDYLGEDYLQKTLQIVKKYANTSDKFFIAESNLLNNPAKLQGLLNHISYIESIGGQVDGIAIRLDIGIATDKAAITDLLKALAQTDKLIQISGLDVGIGRPEAQATSADYTRQEELYKYVVQEYLKIIPVTRRNGINFRSPIDNTTSSTWRPNDPIGLWTETNGHLRKPAYRGVVEALQGN